MKRSYYMYAALGASLLLIGSFVLAFAARSLPRQQTREASSNPSHERITPGLPPAEKDFETETRVKIVDPNEASATPSPSQTTNDGCVIGGCSGEICGERGQADSMASICVYRLEYACYKMTKCERQANGACEWTQNQAFTQCTASKPSGEVVY